MTSSATTHPATSPQTRRHFGPIHRKLSRCGSEFSLSTRAVLANLLERLGQNSSVWPSQATIADDVGISVATVKRSLAYLVASGFVTVRQRPGVAGRANVYDINMAAITAWAERPRRPSEQPSDEPIEESTPSFEETTMHHSLAHGELRKINQEGTPRTYTKKIDHAAVVLLSDNSTSVGEPDRSAAAAAPSKEIQRELVAGYENTIGTVGAYIVDDLVGWADRLPPGERGLAIVKDVWHAVAAANVRRWGYAVKILEAWEAAGWPSREAREAAKQKQPVQQRQPVSAISRSGLPERFVGPGGVETGVDGRPYDIVLAEHFQQHPPAQRVRT